MLQQLFSRRVLYNNGCLGEFYKRTFVYWLDESNSYRHKLLNRKSRHRTQRCRSELEREWFMKCINKLHAYPLLFRLVLVYNYSDDILRSNSSMLVKSEEPTITVSRFCILSSQPFQQVIETHKSPSRNGVFFALFWNIAWLIRYADILLKR